jgi:CRP/FNR family transcriptional activator FtrB
MTTMSPIEPAMGPRTSSREIAEIPLFARLPRASRERLLDGGRVERFAAGATIFSEGETPKYFHALLRGMVDLSCNYRGRHCTVLLLTPGDSFMPAAALFDEPYLLSARTLSASRVLMIDADVVRREAKQTPEFGMAISRLLAGQFRLGLRIILDLKCRSPSERLAAFLLRLHDLRLPGTVAQIPFTKRQLAARIGMQPETLSRTLQVLAANGLYLRGREIIVADRAKAEEFCGADPYPSGSEDELGVYAL